MVTLGDLARAQTWEVGGTIGGAGYIGDLNQSNPVKLSGLAGGAFVKRNFNGYFSAKIGYMYGMISGADSLSDNQQFYNRNLSFSTSLSEFSLMFEFNFIKYLPDVGESRFSPYIFTGITSTFYNPKATYKGVEYELRPLGTEGEAPYSRSTFTIPYGAGIKTNFSGAWNFIIDLGYRNTFTPYLDDVSQAYPNKNQLSSSVARALSDRSGEKTGVYLGTPGTQRGNYRGNDTYMFLGFCLSYTLNTQRWPTF